MSIKDLKSKIDKLENLLNAKENLPAQWAIDSVRTSKEFIPKNYRRAYTEEEIFQEALELTQKYGTKENYEKAFLDSYRDFDHVRFKVKYKNPCGFKRIEGYCDICEAVLTDCNADFCQECHEKYPKKIQEIIEYRKQQEKERCGYGIRK